MNLSDLVLLKHKLSGTSALEIRTHTDIVDGKLSSILNIPMHSDYQSDLNDLIKSLDRLEQEVYFLENNIPDIIKKIDIEILEKTKNFHSRGYIVNGIYGSNSADLYTERELRKMPITEETRLQLITQIRNNTDWHYPALEIGPGDGEWTDHLVASDPLYIIDVHQEFLDNVKKKFNPVYQNRLRTYLTGPSENRSEFDLSMLPKNQFGFILSWNVFNYFPITETKLMLEQCFDLLRPGGSMIFSFNDCEIPKCAEFAETGFSSWMPKSDLINLCKNLGFNNIEYHNPDEVVCWLQIQKSGELSTIKSHQVLGKIINLNN